MISVIVPVYKAEQYLHRCVDSIFAQTFTDFEVLLIDDGSPDNCGAICDEYAAKDNRVRVFHKKNGGVSSARNLGLDNAVGDYIAFCDADDYVSEDWLKNFADAVIDCLDVAFQGYNYLRSDSVEERYPKTMTGKGNLELQKCILELVVSNCYGYICAPIFKKSLIDKLGLRFDEKSSFNEDAQFLSEYLEHVTSFSTISQANYYYIAPESGKQYKGDNFYSVLLTCKSFYSIFRGNLPMPICQHYFPYVKNGAVDYIIKGKSLEKFHIDLYNSMINKMRRNKSFKDKMRNALVLKSDKLGFISKYGLKAINTIIG
jgi:glycosyltransferase involved in cell wall biosynthesis